MVVHDVRACASSSPVRFCSAAMTVVSGGGLRRRGGGTLQSVTGTGVGVVPCAAAGEPSGLPGVILRRTTAAFQD